MGSVGRAPPILEMTYDTPAGSGSGGDRGRAHRCCSWNAGPTRPEISFRCSFLWAEYLFHTVHGFDGFILEVAAASNVVSVTLF